MPGVSVNINDCLKWFGYSSIAEVPTSNMVYRPGKTCYENCYIRATEIQEKWAFRYNVLLNNIASPQSKYPLDRLAALINLRDYDCYDSFRKYVKIFSGGERLRLIRRAKDKGYFVNQFLLGAFASDRFEIHHSKEIRQGRPVDGNLRATIGEMDGATNQYGLFTDPRCRNFSQKSFGVFLELPYRKDDHFVSSKKLVAYIVMYCTGNVGSYIWIIGHAEHLRSGVMDLCHHHIIRMLLDERPSWAANVQFVRYAGMEDGLTGLFQWKRRAGFRPYRLYARQDEVDCGTLGWRDRDPQTDDTGNAGS